MDAGIEAVGQIVFTGVRKRATLLLALAASAVLTSPRLAAAANITWDGTSSTSFSDGTNWVGDTAPKNDYTTTGDVAVFSGTPTANQPSLTASTGLKGLNLESSGWTLGGTGYTLTVAGTGSAGGSGIAMSGTGTNTISSNVAITSKDSAVTGINVATGGTLQITGDVSRVSLGGGGSIAKAGGGTLELYGGGNFGTTLAVSGGTVKAMAGTGGLSSGVGLNIASGGTYDLYGVSVSIKDLNLNAGATLTGSSATVRTATINDYTSHTYNGALTGNLALTFSAGVTTTIAGTANTYAGATTINNSNATLSVASLANGGIASSIGQSSNAASNLVINGGTLKYTGGAVSTDRNFTLGNSGGKVDASGTGALTLTGNATLGANSSPTLTLTGTSTFDNTFSGSLNNNGTGKTSLTKSGAGKWILSGDKAYTGATTVSGGTLVATGSLATTSISLSNAAVFQYEGASALPVAPTLSGTSTFIYNSPAKLAAALSVGSGQTLGGAGILGAVSVAGTLAPGNSPGRITMDSLVLSTTATTAIEIGGQTPVTQYDQVGVVGAITYGGTLNIVSYNSYDLAQEGNYNLFDFASTTGSSFAFVNVGGLGLTNDAGTWTGTQGNTTYAFTESDGVLSVVIPEPTTSAMLLLTALAGGLGSRRSRIGHS